MLLLREERRNGRISLGAFYTRRLFRLAPLFLIAFAMYLVLIFGLGMQADRRASFVANIPYYLLFLPEHAIFFNNYSQPVPFDGTWSLGIEEKFYFLWPVLGFVLLKMRDRARLTVLVSVFAVSVVCSVVKGSWGMALAPYGLLALGCVLAILLDRPGSYAMLSRAGNRWVLLATCTLFLILQFGTDSIMPEHDFYVLYGIVIAAALGGLVVTKSRWVRWLYSKPMVLIGTLSYGLYLFHNFGLNLMEMVIPQSNFAWSALSTSLAFAASLLGVWILHRTVEKPCITIGHRLSRKIAARELRVVAQPLQARPDHDRDHAADGLAAAQVER